MSLFVWDNQASSILPASAANAWSPLINQFWHTNSVTIVKHNNYTDAVIVRHNARNIAGVAPPGQLFHHVPAANWRIYGTAMSIAMVILGNRLTMPHAVQAPFVRPQYLNKYQTFDASNNGNFTTARLMRETAWQTTLTFKYLPIAWFDAHMLPMLEYWREHPVYFIWNTAYPSDGSMLWMQTKSKKLAQPQMSKRGYVDIAIPVAGWSA